MTLPSLTVTRMLRIAAIGLVAFGFASFYILRGNQVGFPEATSNGESKVSAGSHPVMLIWFGLSVALYAALMVVTESTVTVGIASMKLRVVAFIIDFWFSLLGLSAIGALIPLGLEAARTGHFSWAFERSYTVSTDTSVGLPLILITMGLMILYFVIPLASKRLAAS